MLTDDIKQAASELVDLLRARGLTLSAAESCTGGWFAKSVVDVPGASAVFFGGVVSYVNEVKEKVLSVSREDLAQYTAVSAPVAAAMAEGARRLMGSDLAVSVTGLAGPGGGTPDIPVGRVYLGLAQAGKTETVTLDLPGDREAVRMAAVLHMINEITKRLI
ncbi:MAG: CinA family protein [Clostridia bacterium]|nr:CinA family protein [Clostridia bacterium]